MKLLMTDRYHAAIFSILANTPVIPFESTTFKTRGLFQFFKYPIPVLDIHAVNCESEVESKIDYVMQNNESIRMQLADIQDWLINEVHQKFELLTRIR